MLTFKQSLILLVSIITVLAIIAVGTGLSPLYWPLPKNLPRGNDSSVIMTTKTINSTSSKTQMTTRIKLAPKRYEQITTAKLVSAFPETTNILRTNVTTIQSFIAIAQNQSNL